MNWMLTAGIFAGIISALFILDRVQETKKFRKGTEYGSARWGRPKDMKPFIDPNFYKKALF